MGKPPQATVTWGNAQVLVCLTAKPESSESLKRLGRSHRTLALITQLHRTIQDTYRTGTTQTLITGLEAR
jgi:hypothetical protein